MPNLKYIFQGLSGKDDHLSGFEYICSLDNINKIILSAAFVRKSGIELIDEFISPYIDRSEIFIGIRNGVTSIQSILRLLRKNIKPFVIDTANPSVIFHPKVFLSYSDVEARILIGSANLTTGGLAKNIEAGMLINIDLSIQDEKNIVNQIIDSIYELKDKYPTNIFQIINTHHAYELYKEGRLIDERISTNFKVTGKRSEDKTNDIERMSLKTRKINIQSRKIRKKFKTRKISSAKQSRSEWVLLWESKPLTERDLNIPSGRNTNPTGSMLLKKGNMENIDHRHFFRQIIFNDLDWQFDTHQNRTHLERTKSNFELIIKGLSYDVFNLQLTHNSRTDTRAYEQRNSMTQIHWGEARKYIARRDLLNCILRLYKPINIEDIYVIEIS